ncbi:MAG: nitroreductase family protein [Myxococcales bacterium]|nr:nitroreductase family protein [Myxococcales bacterium]
MLRAMDLESCDQLLSTTRSVRRRLDLDRPVERELLEACIDLAAQAPTGANREAWRFLVVTDPERKAQLGQLYRRAFERYRSLREAHAHSAGTAPPQPRPAQQALAERLDRFPALILACIEGRPDPLSIAGQVAFYGSILPAAWSLMLALRARGVGTTWTTLHLVHEREAAALLGIPEEVTQTVLLPVAYMRNARLRPAQRRPAREITYWDAWGRTRS